jgi:UDP-glucuronate decarboxylase
MPKKIIFDKKNVLVAGGAGFIGSHLCDELIKTCKVICVDNFISGSERNIDHLLANPNFVFINHDLAKPIDLAMVTELKKFKIEFQGIQEIYNLACPMSPLNFLANRLATLEANSSVVKNLLDLALIHNAKFLHFSSSVVYGPRRSDDPEFKARESDPGVVDQLSSRASYDEGKRFSETLVASYRNVYQLDTKIIRVFRIYGPRMESNDGQMIPDFINNALEDKDLVINGDENFSSSFCYIEDLLDAVSKVMSTDIAGPINVGSDVDCKLVDLAQIIINETGSKSKIIHAETMVFLTELILPDIKLARNELGWMPVVTLENGLRKTIFDVKAQKKLQGFGSY